MSGLNDLKTRVKYYGGARQQDRMIQDKLAALKSSMLASYQAATVIFDDGREFRCLINPSKVNLEEDVKVISIPYKDIWLNNPIKTKQEYETGIAPGQVLEWKETKSHWLVYNQHLEELAYFRGELRRCDYQVDLEGKKHWVYFKRMDKADIAWHEKSDIYFNSLNYTALLYIASTEETRDYFSRFKIIEIEGDPWEVQNVDKLTTKGLIIVKLKEWYKNSYAEPSPEVPSSEELTDRRISGESVVYPYMTYSYTLVGGVVGTWSISNPKKAKIIEQTSNTVTIEIITGRSGSVDLVWTSIDEVITLPLTIESL